MIFESLLLLSIGLGEFIKLPIGIGAVSITDVVSCLFFFMFTVVLLFRGKVYFPCFARRSFVVVLCVFASFIVNSMVSAVFSEVPVEGLKGTYNFVILSLIGVLLVYRLSDSQKLNRFLGIFCVLGFVFSGIAVAASLGLVDIPWSTNRFYSRQIGSLVLPFSRSGGIFNNLGSLGIFLCYALPFLLLRILDGSRGASTGSLMRHGRFVLNVTVFICVALGTLAPQSRGVFLGGMAAITTTVVIYSFSFGGRLLKGAVVLCILISVGALWLYWESILMAFYLMASGSFEYRIDSGRLVLESITFLGSGYNAFLFLEESGEHVIHNGFLNLLHSYGVLGVSIFVILDLVCIRWLVKVYRSNVREYVLLSISLMGTLMGIHALAMSISSIALNHFWIVFFLAAALVNNYKKYVLGAGTVAQRRPLAQTGALAAV